MYDLLDGTDVILNILVQCGKEAALLGVPSVLYAPQLAFYPADLGFHGDTEASYFSAIDEALTQGWSFERAPARLSLACLRVHPRGDFGRGQFSKEEGFARPLSQRIVQQLDRRVSRDFEQRWDCVRRQHGSPSEQVLSKSSKAARGLYVDIRKPDPSRSLARETELVTKALRRIVNQLYSGEEARKCSRLHARIAALSVR